MEMEWNDMKDGDMMIAVLCRSENFEARRTVWREPHDHEFAVWDTTYHVVRPESGSGGTYYTCGTTPKRKYGTRIPPREKVYEEWDEGPSFYHEVDGLTWRG